jgi:hypothetical protein
MVKVSAPYLAALDTNMFQSGLDPGDEGDQVGLGRYCKDHAGMICHPVGFYSKEKRGLWVHFDRQSSPKVYRTKHGCRVHPEIRLTRTDWIPPELGQQTQTLLRMVMESKLTAKVSSTYPTLCAVRLIQLRRARVSYTRTNFEVG